MPHYTSPTVSNVGFSVEDGEPAGALRTYWWRYTPGVSGEGIFTATGNGSAGLAIHVFTGSVLEDLVEVGSNTSINPSVTVDLVAETTYYVRIGTLEDVDVSYVLDIDAPAATLLPGVPPNVRVSGVSTSSVSLAWDAAVNATSYEYRQDGGAATSAGTGLTKEVTGLTADTDYGFEVRSTDGSLFSAWSPVVTAHTDAEPPPPPTGGSETLFGSSFGTVNASAYPSSEFPELDAYRNLGRVAGFQYLSDEFASLAGITETPLLKVSHCYMSGLTLNSVANGFLTKPGVAVIINLHSDHAQMASGALDSSVVSLLNSIKAKLTGSLATKTVWLIWEHEPENDGSGSSYAAGWRNGFARFAKVVVDNRGSYDFRPTFCLMASRIRANNVAEYSMYLGTGLVSALEAQGLDPGFDVVFAPDGYSQNPATVLPADRFDLAFNTAYGLGFRRFGISETACKSYTSSQRAAAAAWATALGRYGRTWSMDYVCWFASAPGNGIDLPESWFIYGAANKIRYAELCRDGGAD